VGTKSAGFIGKISRVTLIPAHLDSPSPVPSCQLSDVDPTGKSSRSGDEILLSAIAYCEWRAGTSWSKLHRTGQRDNPERWYYLHAVRLLQTVRYMDVSPVAVPKKPAARHLPSLHQISKIQVTR
jgi:hypothetical protein